MFAFLDIILFDCMKKLLEPLLWLLSDDMFTFLSTVSQFLSETVSHCTGCFLLNKFICWNCCRLLALSQGRNHGIDIGGCGYTIRDACTIRPRMRKWRSRKRACANDNSVLRRFTTLHDLFHACAPFLIVFCKPHWRDYFPHLDYIDRYISLCIHYICIISHTNTKLLTLKLTNISSF